MPNRFLHIALRFALASSLAACNGAATPARSVVEPPILIDHVTVVDPRDGTKVSDRSILIRNGRIAAIGAPDSIERSTVARIIDARGKYIVPGYNNMHTHVLDAPNRANALALMLAEGVTGFRQMAGSEDLLEARRAGRFDLGHDAPALLAMPGRLLLPTNVPKPSYVADEIDRQRKEGADFIKVALVRPDVFSRILAEARKAGLPVAGHLQEGTDALEAATGGMASIEHLGTGDVLYSACARNKAELIADAAAHASAASPPVALPGFVERIVLSRSESRLINPAAYATPENVARLKRALDGYDDARCRALAATFARHQTWQVPTLVRLRTQELADDPVYTDHPDLAFIPASSIEAWRDATTRYRQLPDTTRATFHAAYSRQLALTKMFADEGVPMMTGTDGSWQQPGQTLHEEFDALAAAGLPPLQILRMTTIYPARFLGRTGTMGTVERGKNADLVLLSADPLLDVRNFKSVVGVVRAGKYHSASNLQKLTSSLFFHPR